MAKAPKTNYMRHCENFVSDLKDNHATEYALMPFNGAFTIIHKRAFHVSNLAVDNILFGDCIFKGRGTAALQHVTPGTMFPMFPIRPVITKNGEISEPKQGEPFNDRVIILSGGEYLDGANKWFEMSLSDDHLTNLAETVRCKKRSNTVRGNPYGAAEVLNFTACNEKHVSQIFEDYFPLIPESERNDYLLYFFADPTTMLAYATSVFSETVTHAPTRRGRVDISQSTSDKVYVHPITFRAHVDNKRLNVTEDPGHMCYLRPVVHASNEVMLCKERKVLNSNVQDPVILEYNEVHDRVFSHDLEKYTEIQKDPFMASQIASVILSTFAAPVQMNMEYPNAESALNNRLNFIRTAMIHQQKFRNDIMNKDAIAAGSVGRSILNTVSPSVIRTYRYDGDHGNLAYQHGSSGYSSPWLPTQRAAALYTAQRAKAYKLENASDSDPDMIKNLEMASVLASSVINLAAIVDLNNMYNAESFTDRLTMIANAGDTSHKKFDDYRAHEIKMGGCELGKEMDSAIEVILAHFYYDIAQFKRYFLQYSWYFLSGLDGIKLDIDRLPLKDDVYECAACGGLPFYDRRNSSTPPHCFCYILLLVFAKLTHMNVTTPSSAKKIADQYMSELYKNPYSSEMTSMKMLLSCRVVESKSRYGSFGSLRLHHANKVDGFKIREKREGQNGVVKRNPLPTGTSSTITSSGVGAGDLRKPAQDSSDQKDDEAYKEAVELSGIVRRIMNNCPTVLSGNQSRLIDNSEGSTTLQYLNEVCKRTGGDSQGGQCVPRPGQIILDGKVAVKKHILNDPHAKERVCVDALFKKDVPFQVSPSERSGLGRGGEIDNHNGWGSVMNTAVSDNSTFSWEPPTKQRKQVKSGTFRERIRHFIQAVTHAFVSSENGQRFDSYISPADISPKYASLLTEWQEADIETQKKYAMVFSRAFLDIMVRASCKNTPYTGLIGRALEEYLDAVAANVRNIHASVAAELNMTPEGLDESAVRDIVHYNNLNGELFSWIDPTSGDPQVSSRSERHAHFMLVRHMWDIRAMNNLPETTEIHPLQIEKFTSGASAENGPHSVRISTTLPLYTTRVVEGGVDEPPAISLNPSAAAAIDVMCSHDLPIQMKIGIGMSAFDPESSQKTDTGSVDGTEKLSGSNHSDYGTLPAGKPMENGGMFRPFPLLAHSGSVVSSRCRVRNANDLATDIRQKSLKMHKLGLPDSVDLTYVDDGVRWVMEYLEDRRDMNNHPSWPCVIHNLMLDLNTICGVTNGVYYMMMDTLSKYLPEEVMSVLRPLTTDLAMALFRKQLMFRHLQALFTRRPELMGAMTIICACAELYGAKQHNNDPIFDRGYERDTGIVKITIAGSLRLFVGRTGGNKVVRNHLEKQTALMPIRTTYLDELITKNRTASITAYGDEDVAHSSQLITAATVVSYPSRDGNKMFTRIRGGAPFNRRTLASGICRMGHRTDEKEITLIKKPLVHFPNAIQRGSADKEELLITCTLDTLLYMYHTNEITLTKIAKYFIGVLSTRVSVKSDGWLDSSDDNSSEGRISTILLQERFASDTDDSKQLFKKEMFPKLYSVMCGGPDDTKIGRTLLLDSFLTEDGYDYDDDDEDDE